MSDMGDYWNDVKEHKRALRVLYGVECPRCRQQRPKAYATILLPGQKCFDGYRDPRPRLSEEAVRNALLDLENNGGVR